MAPPHFTSANATGEALSSAPTPKVVSATCPNVPSAIPATDAIPAKRP